MTADPDRLTPAARKALYGADTGETPMAIQHVPATPTSMQRRVDTIMQIAAALGLSAPALPALRAVVVEQLEAAEREARSEVVIPEF